MKQNTIYTIVFALLVGLVSFGVSQAYASDTTNKSVQSISTTNTYSDWNQNDYQIIQTHKVDVCISLNDLYMDKRLPDFVLKQVEGKNFTAKIISKKDRIENVAEGADCKFTINIERAINENLALFDPSTKYIISGNSATIFSYKTYTPFNPNAQPMQAMVNWNCMYQAHKTKYFDNYQIQEGGFEATYQGYCDPFLGINYSQFGELPLTVIKKSVDTVLDNWK